MAYAKHGTLAEKYCQFRKAPGGLEKIIFVGQLGILLQGEVESRRNTLCISRLSKRSIAAKEPLFRQKEFLKVRQK